MGSTCIDCGKPNEAVICRYCGADQAQAAVQKQARVRRLRINALRLVMGILFWLPFAGLSAMAGVFAAEITDYPWRNGIVGALMGTILSAWPIYRFDKVFAEDLRANQ